MAFLFNDSHTSSCKYPENPLKLPLNKSRNHTDGSSLFAPLLIVLWASRQDLTTNNLLTLSDLSDYIQRNSGCLRFWRRWMTNYLKGGCSAFYFLLTTSIFISAKYTHFLRTLYRRTYENFFLLKSYFHCFFRFFFNSIDPLAKHSL